MFCIRLGELCGIAIILLHASQVHLSSAQSCSSQKTCSSCLTYGYSSYRWCSNQNTAQYDDSGCCSTSSSSCPSEYRYGFSSCSGSATENPNWKRTLSQEETLFMILVCSTYVLNLCAVARYCKAMNLEAQLRGFLLIAIFFHIWVWCCLVFAGRRSRQVVIMQAPQQAQLSANSQPLGQPFVAQAPGQPGIQQYPQAQPGYQPKKPYPIMQQPENPYPQAPNPYVQPGNPYSQPQNPYGQPQNPYAQNPYAQNPYAHPNDESSAILKPQ
jgi:hypothetical protein